MYSQESFLSHTKTKNPVDQSFACYALAKAVKVTVNNCSYKSNLPLRHFIHISLDLTLLTPVLVLDISLRRFPTAFLGREHALWKQT